MRIKHFLIAAFACNVFAQQANAQIDFPTPNAASLGTYGQIPVSYYNGLPNISIPMYELQYKDIKIPIALQYHSGGIKPEEQPGWVGLGWNLQAGGAITRIVNGLPDETDDITIGNMILHKYGYFFHSGDLDDTAWASDGLNKYATINWQPILYGSPPYDAEPDEFMFNIGDFSGSFYMSKDKQGNIVVKVKSKEKEDLNITAKLYSEELSYRVFKTSGIVEHHLPNLKIQQPHFMQFTITRSNGMQYIFGGDINAMDMTTSPNGSNMFTLPTTWYLSKIVSPNGYSVSLEYKKEGDPIIKIVNRSKLCAYLPNSSTGYCAPVGEDINRSYLILHPSYLKNIKSPDGNEIEFITSKAVQLNYDFTDNRQAEVFQQMDQYTKWSPGFMDANYYLKLDTVKIKNLKTFAFSYIENANQRLRLDSISGKDASGNLSSLYSYKFKYNPGYLPSYNSMETDNWGYYNGKSYKDVSVDNFNQLYSFRSSDEGLMKSEMLEKIIYPTGGFTKFIYEQHKYAKRATQHPFELVADSGATGGLRIKTIISKADENAVDSLKKEYLYINDEGKSSGILSGIPLYRTEGKQHVQYSYRKWIGTAYFSGSVDYDQRFLLYSDYMLNPLSSTNGSHITYSKVIEQSSDGGQTRYSYSNHDTKPDENFVNMYCSTEGLLIKNPFTSRELERGLLLSATHYKAVNIPVSKTINEYNSDSTRYNDYVKAIASEIIIGPAGDNFERHTAKKIYSFYPYLKKSTEFIYSQAGQDSLITTKEYEYYANSSRLKILKQTDSKQQIIQTQYKYPTEFTSIAVYDSMVKRNILPVIEQTTTKGTTELSKTKTGYDFGNNKLLILPDSIKKAVLGNALETEITFNQYDNYGNLLEYTTKDGLITTIIWGYNNLYPVAKIVGANLTTVKSKITIDTLTESLSFDAISKLESIPNAFVTTYRYKPLVGMTTETNPNGRTTYYDYDSSGRLAFVRDHDGNIIQRICYNYSGQIEDCYKGKSFYTSKALSKVYTKNNCPAGLKGTAHVFSMPSGVAKSIESQEDADAKALALADSSGQQWVNQTAGSCHLYVNEEKSAPYTKSNCPPGYKGTSVTYTVYMGKYYSDISQPDADNKATGELGGAGPAYANANGSCVPDIKTFPVYVNNATGAYSFKLEMTNVTTGVVYTFNNIYPGTAQQGTFPSDYYHLKITPTNSSGRTFKFYIGPTSGSPQTAQIGNFTYIDFRVSYPNPLISITN